MQDSDAPFRFRLIKQGHVRALRCKLRISLARRMLQRRFVLPCSSQHRHRHQAHHSMNPRPGRTATHWPAAVGPTFSCHCRRKCITHAALQQCIDGGKQRAASATVHWHAPPPPADAQPAHRSCFHLRLSIQQRGVAPHHAASMNFAALSMRVSGSCRSAIVLRNSAMYLQKSVGVRPCSLSAPRCFWCHVLAAQYDTRCQLHVLCQCARGSAEVKSCSPTEAWE